MDQKEENKSQISGKSAADRRATAELTEMMSERLLDPSIIERYGTSLKMTMGREYSNYLKTKYDKLKKEFSKIDKNSDEEIDFDEMYEFFKNYESKTGVSLSKEYIESIYDMIDQDKNHKISVQEFIFSYMVIEEKLRHKQMHLKEIIDEYSHLKERYNKGIKDNQDEKLNAFGVAQNAELEIIIIEAYDLKSTNFSGRVDPYVVISFNGKEKNSNFKPDTLCPVWNESMRFDIKSLESVAEVKVLDYTTKECIGVAYIKLKDYKDQNKTEINLTLKAMSGPEEMGEIRLRVKASWSKLEYFSNKIEQCNEKLEIAEKETEDVSKYLNLLDQPFGIITYGEIENILNNDVLEVPKDKEEILQKQRMSVLPQSSLNFSASKQNSMADKIDQAFRGTLKTDVEWSSVSRYLMYALIILSCLQMFERSDFTGLILGVIIWYLFIQQSNLNVLDYVKKCIIAMVCATVYDFFWLFSHYDGYWDNDNVDKSMKEFTYVIAVINFIIKIALAIALDVNFAKQRKRNKQVQIESSRKTIMNTGPTSSKASPENIRQSVSAFFHNKKNNQQPFVLNKA